MQTAARMKRIEKSGFTATFEELKGIFEPYAGRLHLTVDNESYYYLETEKACYNKKPLCFGAVRKGKSFVSFNLMPIYVFSDLTEKISPELKKHMQGKQCFNFKKAEPELFRELSSLAKQGFRRYESATML